MLHYLSNKLKICTLNILERGYLNTEAECAQQGVALIPMVAEASGCWGPDGLKTLRQLAKTAAGRPGGDSDVFMGQLMQSLCVIIRSAKAVALAASIA